MEPSEESSLKVSYAVRSHKLDIWIKGLNFPVNSCVNLYQRTGFTHQNWVMFASTEVVSGTREPVFKSRLLIQYFFSVKQEICAEVIDMSTNQIAGKAEFTIGNLVTTPNQALSIPICKDPTVFGDPNEKSYLVIKAEVFTDSLDELLLQLSGSFYKSYVFTPKTFLSLWKLDSQAKKFVQVARGGLSLDEAPHWEPLQVRITELCEKDYNRKIRLVVHKIPKLHQEKIAGHVDFTLDDLIHGNLKQAEILKFPEKLNGNSEIKKSAGTVVFEKKEIIKVPQFLDYVFGGLEICSSIGIDFSNRGGPFSNPSSLHYFNEGLESLYEQLAKLFAEVLAPYSPRKDVVAYGFGATILDSAENLLANDHDFCFSLNGKPGLSSFSELKLLSENYRKSTKLIEPNQLRFITPVLETLRAHLSKDLYFNSKKRYYNIILLLEEEIDDIQEVIDFMGVLSQQIAVTLLLVGMGKGPYPNLEGFNINSGQAGTFYDSKGDALPPNTIAFLSLQDVKMNTFGLVKEMLKFIPDRIYTAMIKENLLPDRDKLSLSTEISPKKDPGKRVKIFDNYEPVIQQQQPSFPKM